MKIIIVRYLPGSCGKMLASYIYYLNNPVPPIAFEEVSTHADFLCEYNQYHNLSKMKQFSTINFDNSIIDIKFYNSSKKDFYYVIDTHFLNLNDFTNILGIPNIKIINIVVSNDKLNTINKLFEKKRNTKIEKYSKSFNKKFYEYKFNFSSMNVNFDDIFNSKIIEKENTKKLCEFLNINFDESCYQQAKNLFNIWYEKNQSLL